MPRFKQNKKYGYLSVNNLYAEVAEAKLAKGAPEGSRLDPGSLEAASHGVSASLLQSGRLERAVLQIFGELVLGCIRIYR